MGVSFLYPPGFEAGTQFCLKIKYRGVKDFFIINELIGGWSLNFGFWKVTLHIHKKGFFFATRSSKNSGGLNFTFLIQHLNGSFQKQHITKINFLELLKLVSYDNIRIESPLYSLH